MVLVNVVVPEIVNGIRADSRLVPDALEAVSVPSYDSPWSVESSGPVPGSNHTETRSPCHE